jgi:hypothetical protein
MGALDAINSRFGRESVRPGGLAKRSGGWAMKRSNLSPAYTTRLEDVLKVRALPMLPEAFEFNHLFDGRGINDEFMPTEI